MILKDLTATELFGICIYSEATAQLFITTICDLMTIQNQEISIQFYINVKVLMRIPYTIIPIVLYYSITLSVIIIVICEVKNSSTVHYSYMANNLKIITILKHL